MTGAPMTRTGRARRRAAGAPGHGDVRHDGTGEAGGYVEAVADPLDVVGAEAGDLAGGDVAGEVGAHKVACARPACRRDGRRQQFITARRWRMDAGGGLENTEAEDHQRIKTQRAGGSLARSTRRRRRGRQGLPPETPSRGCRRTRRRAPCDAADPRSRAGIGSGDRRSGTPNQQEGQPLPNKLMVVRPGTRGSGAWLHGSEQRDRKIGDSGAFRRFGTGVGTG